MGRSELCNSSFDRLCCWMTRFKPRLARSTTSASRLVSDLKNMVMILWRSCASCSWPAGGVLSSGHAMALHMRRMHAARSACMSSPAPGATPVFAAATAASSFSASDSASCSKPTKDAWILMSGSGFVERQKSRMRTT